MRLLEWDPALESRGRPVLGVRQRVVATPSRCGSVSPAPPPLQEQGHL